MSLAGHMKAGINGHKTGGLTTPDIGSGWATSNLPTWDGFVNVQPPSNNLLRLSPGLESNRSRSPSASIAEDGNGLLECHRTRDDEDTDSLDFGPPDRVKRIRTAQNYQYA
ncbi:hypothetical protein FRB94_014431 [Tulasnella sp. JGI-2019a]|nr:hypothetical protein FRB93_011348 [Tulasnella sp. JGI-2019a]KAG8989393.1 hypothetical protein FRB94_014431 [Tulasnella sp. JGI-2019a]